MLLVTLRGMFAHKLRLVLTTASIALGVAFLAGTLILTDTMKLAFDQVFSKVSVGTDVVVRQQAAYAQTQGAGTSHAPIPAAVLDQVRAVDGVRAAEGSVTGYALLTDTAGHAVLAPGGAPTLGYSMAADPGLRGAVQVRTGRAPAGPTEVAIDATSAATHHIALSSRIKVLFSGPTRTFTVVGTVGFGAEKDLGGSSAAYFDLATAQRVLATPGTFDQIDVSAVTGVGAADLTRRLSPVLPPSAEAVTGPAVAAEASRAVKDGLGFVSVLFAAFAAVALFVGSFIIWNTFTMTVSQRSREIALLRAVGATRRQVARSLLAEALLLGTAASVLGAVLGAGVARALTVLMRAVGFSLPSTTMQIQPRTVLVSVLVGTLVTVVAALVPARRGARVLPIQALREAVPGAEQPSWRRGLAGGALAGLGLTALLLALTADAGMAVFGLGVLGVLLGVTTLAPLAVRPMAAALGLPLRLRGTAGELAGQNATRNPRRTAATAAALMVGLTLVVSIGVFASSLKASFGGVLGDSTNADLFVTRASSQAEGFSPEVVRAVGQVPGVREVSATGYGQARFDGESASFAAVDPATAGDLFNLDVSTGSVRDLGNDAVLVSRQAAQSHRWQVGDEVSAEFAQTGAHDLRVAGVFDRTGGFLGGDYLISLDTQAQRAGDALTTAALVLLQDGADRATVQARISAALRDHPDAKVLDRAGYEKDAGGVVDQLVTFVTVMLLLAVLIALLGIINTLALSVSERTRELGLLRAIGMSRGQVRAMVRWESVVISLIGASSGAALGVGLGAALARALADQGIRALSVPVGQVAGYVLLAAVAGVVAGVAPARRAARVDVLRAVVTD